MKILILTLALLCVSNIATAQTRVDGYYKKNGTYVQPHYRSSADSTKSNNWSTKGNTNPYTGQRGTRNPSPSYNRGSMFAPSKNTNSMWK